MNLRKKTTCSPSRDKTCRSNFDSNTGLYVISCEKSGGKRLSKLMNTASKEGVKFCQEVCVNGRKFDSKMICEMKHNRIVLSTADITPIEVAISLSHYNSWVRILNSCEDYGVVLEDDCFLKSGFVKNIDDIISNIPKKGFGICHLWNGNWGGTDKQLKPVVKFGKLQILQETEMYVSGTVGYIISKEFAKVLVNKMFPIRYAVDGYIGSVKSKFKHYTVKMTKKGDCYISPILGMKCGGKYGTGESTTQDYEAATVKKYRCRKYRF